MSSDFTTTPRSDASAPPPVSSRDDTESALQRAPQGVLSEQKTVISKRRRPGERLGTTPALGFGDIERSLEGKRLGHFELQQCIGGGGMGVVFRGLDTTLGRTVAVKVVSNDTTDEETLRRFRNEAQSAARLDHPNIARVYYVGEDGGWNYIVFEYIDGVNIRDLVLERGPLPLEDVISYTLQVAEALGHAAQRDVVHRDIKPSNILVMADGRAKLVDMGLARLHQVESNANDLTATGVTLGTFDYISPEQARDPRTADVRSDLYSLGCTFYYMLTGLPPFPEGTVLQKLLSHSSEPPRDPRDTRGEVPEEVAAIALRLMAKQPSQRFQSPQELVAALLLACDRLGITPGGGTTPVVITSRPTWWDALERHVPWVVPTLLLVLVVLAVEQWQGPDGVAHFDMQRRSDRVVVEGDERPAPPPRDAAERPGAAVRPSHTGESAAPLAEADPARKPEKAGTPPRDRPAEGSTLAAAGATPPEPSADARSLVKTAPPSPKASASLSAAAAGGAERRDASSQDRAATDVSEGRFAPEEVRQDAVAGQTPVLIVRPDAYGDGESNIVESFEAALQRAATARWVSVIELHFDEMVEQPLQIPLGVRELTVRAGVGYRPLLVFRPDAFGLGVERRMLNQIGGTLTLDGVHFRVELPNDMSEGWSLFHLNHADGLQLRNCTATIVNPFRNRAAFIAVQGPRETAMENTAQALSAKTPKIVLENCVARGQAAFVRAAEGLPLALTWRQGFLATTEPLVETAGLSTAAVNDVIRIHLENVTASLDSGLVHLEMRDRATALPQLAVECRHCLFVHPREVPLIEYRGVEDIARAVQRFEMSGEDNFYDFTDTRWRIVTARGDMREFGWEDQDNGWYNERRAERGLRWRRPLPTDREVTQRLPRDYLLEPNESRLAGFDLERLPILP